MALCQIGRNFDAKHPTCKSCQVGCAAKSAGPTLDEIGKRHGLEPKPTKYRAQKVVIDGITFHSKKEGMRFNQLKMLEKAGKIQNLALQVPFVLAPAVTINGRKKPPLRYICDFQYQEYGVIVVEDTKGFRDAVYKIKRHLMSSVHNITIKET